MKKKEMPISRVIDRELFLYHVYLAVLRSNDKRLKHPYNDDVIYFNEKSLEILWRLVESVLYYHLEHWHGVNNRIVVRPFRSVALEAYEVPEVEKTNNLTGKTIKVPKRKRFKAHFSKRYVDHFNGVCW